MAKFNSRSTGTKTVNHEGGQAFKPTHEMELAMAALTTFVENKFYEKKDDTLKRIVALCEKVSPEFLGKLAIYARRECNMRSISHVLLGELARLHKGQRAYIEAGIVRVDDMSEIIAYYGNQYGKPIPNSIKKAISKRLKDFNAYQLGKYKGGGKDVKLVDLFNICHPKPRDEAQSQMWKDLLTGKLESPDTWEVLISTAKDKDEAKTRWEGLVAEDKIGYMALLRNLRNLDKYGVNQATLEKAANKIKDPIEVAKSKQLPFRYLSAYKNAPNTIFKDAVSYALDAAVTNIPSFDGKTAVFCDVSGSMNNVVSAKSTMTCAEIGILFGMSLWKSNPTNNEFYTFDNALYGFNLSSRTPLIDLINSIHVNGGGTSTHVTFAYLRQQKKVVDQVFILSDNEGYGGDVNAEFEAYRREVNPNVKLFAIDLQGYGHLQFPQKNVYHIAGWSEKIFDVIKLLLQDKDALLNTIKSYEISKERYIHTSTDDTNAESEASKNGDGYCA